jgi:hypothetical protein
MVGTLHNEVVALHARPARTAELLSERQTSLCGHTAVLESTPACRCAGGTLGLAVPSPATVPSPEQRTRPRADRV